ncbi:MAG: hypothetical protein RR584_15885 [Comamonas sp.]
MQGFGLSGYTNLLQLLLAQIELAQGANYTRERETGKVTVTRYVCERCGTNWEYENDKKNQHAGWSLTGRRATKN